MQNTIAKQGTISELTKSARIIGVLMLIQVTLGILLNFFILKPILNLDPQSVMSNIQYLVGFSTLLALLLSSFNISCGLFLPKDITQHPSRTFVFLIIFASAGFVLCALEYIRMTEYVSYASSLMQQSSTTLTTEQELIRQTLATGRNEAHFLSIIVSSASVLLFYVVTLRHKLIPKPLSIFAIFACTMQIIAVGHTLFALAIPTIMQLPLLISQVVIPIFLITKGFNAKTIASNT